MLTLQVGLCQTYGFFNQTPRFPRAPFDGKRRYMVAPAYNLLGPNRHFYFPIGRAKLRGSAKVAFSVVNSEIRWSQLVPSTTVLTLHFCPKCIICIKEYHLPTNKNFILDPMCFGFCNSNSPRSG